MPEEKPGTTTTNCGDREWVPSCRELKEEQKVRT